MATVYEGTWEEVAVHAPEWTGRRVKVIVEEASQSEVIRERVERLERGLATARELSKDFPPVPERHITLDFLYPDEDESR